MEHIAFKNDLHRAVLYLIGASGRNKNYSQVKRLNFSEKFMARKKEREHRIYVAGK